MRAIDADALKARLDFCTTKGMGGTIAFTFKHMVDEQPTVTFEPHWIPVTENCECDLMDDLISKQQAIEALYHVDEYNGRSVEAIRNLPPANVVPVVRCKDCKFRDEDAFCTGRGFPCQLVPDDGFCDKGEKE